ncbi:MAG: hypothetical protein M3P01_03555 [Actinomycetota bacterium]|nr:hypothetical protein [Actinomycetota bacterium]
MSGVKKPTARESFDSTIADARRLVLLARTLKNRRLRSARTELRERVGLALRIAKKDRVLIECVESDDLFIVLKPGASVSRSDLAASSLQPLLRQALVVACAAVETFTADRVMERLGTTLRSGEPPSRLLDAPMTVGDWLWIEASYQQRLRGLRRVIEAEVRQLASPAPSQVGLLFSWVSESSLWKRVDTRRGVARGTSEKELERIYLRRNKITHAGDRAGRKVADISVDGVDAAITTVEAIVAALDEETGG